MVIMSNTSYRQELIEPEIEREKKNASGMIEWNALSIPRRLVKKLNIHLYQTLLGQGNYASRTQA